MSGERKRDYKKEYAQYQGTPEQIHNRGLRNAARREYKEAHPHADLRGKDIDHKKMLDKGGGNSMSNLRPLSIKVNRGWRKGQD
jgi:hypothetical protein